MLEERAERARTYVHIAHHYYVSCKFKSAPSSFNIQEIIRIGCGCRYQRGDQAVW